LNREDAKDAKKYFLSSQTVTGWISIFFVFNFAFLAPQRLAISLMIIGLPP
jgi:hypothetical protein